MIKIWTFIKQKFFPKPEPKDPFDFEHERMLIGMAMIIYQLIHIDDED